MAEEEHGRVNCTRELIQNFMPSNSRTFCLTYAHMSSFFSPNDMEMSRPKIDFGANTRKETSPCNALSSAILWEAEFGGGGGGGSSSSNCQFIYFHGQIASAPHTNSLSQKQANTHKQNKTKTKSSER